MTRFISSVLAVASLGLAGCEAIVNPKVESSSGSNAVTASGTTGSSSSAASTGSESSGSSSSSTSTASTGSSSSASSGTEGTISTASSDSGSSASSSSGTGTVGSSGSSGTTVIVGSGGTIGNPNTTGTSGTTSTTGTTGTTGTTCGIPVAGQLYVNRDYTGSLNIGTQGCPYVNITDALGAIPTIGNATNTIHVAQGTYDSSIGESFPLMIPANVTVIGDSSVGARTLFTIDGSGSANFGGQSAHYTVDLRGTLQYMQVKNSAQNGGGTSDFIVVASRGAPHMALVTIDGTNSTQAAVALTSVAVSGADATSLLIDQQSDIFWSNGDGILVQPGSTTAPTLHLRGTHVHDNGMSGVEVRSPSPTTPPTADLDGQSSANRFDCNTAYGVQSQVSVDATFDTWAHSPGNITSGQPPADVNDSTLVNTANAIGGGTSACLPRPL